MMMTSPLQKFLSIRLGNFRRSEAGSIALWVAAAMPVILGGAALSVDASRLYNMDQDLQSAADAFARAGAAELDQRSDSIARATNAVATLVENEQKTGADGRGNVRVKKLRYLKSVPAKDYMDVSADQITNDPSEARYVEVEVVPERVSTMFPQGVVRSITSVELGAVSTAGFSQDVCGVAPVFICNPFELSTKTSIYEAMEDPSFRRRQIEFKTQGPNAQYSAGNFGYLDPFEGNSGAKKIKDAIAIDHPDDVCLSQSKGVKLRPGSINSASQAFNVRFDMYDGPYKSKINDPAFAPAANVVKGYSTGGNGSGKNACNAKPDASAFGMPRDDSFSTPEYSPISLEQLGSGNWDFVEYMRVNHNYRPYITIDNTTYRLDYVNKQSFPSEPPSRYSIYRWEIDNNRIPGALAYGTNAQSPEEGTPQCHKYGAHSDPEIDRRVISVAVLNCGEIEASGQSMNGRTDYLPVETFVKVFITEPMANGQDGTLYGEIIGPVVQGEDKAAQDKIALTR